MSSKNGSKKSKFIMQKKSSAFNLAGIGSGLARKFLFLNLKVCKKHVNLESLKIVVCD